MDHNMGQTALTHTCPIREKNQISGCSEGGIALDLGSRDRAFESPHSDQLPLEHELQGEFFIYAFEIF